MKHKCKNYNLPLSSARDPRNCPLSYHQVLTKKQPLRNTKANPHVGLSYLVPKKNGTGIVLSNKKMKAERGQNLHQRPLNPWD